ncbi:PaaI family thioesterase [Novosphingobium mangrovi (ex Huang et al. 2023)]|uniref:PaaI family thioesterase n=1 Tax=Novosphingobium mangrovi (ex Huang et al. 2023) TaxID=2976432 RepID=A0ABT2I8Z7_9SPHN|nr:PaaI family thioesterase [Novosphingobium mangrovi (ex Huang et al. 2023)]MCT2401294.1 PaaI family thioesterase [Novosphingobium mangrovi (ex Huang et al. 2023)]
MPPDLTPGAAGEVSGADLHWRALERLYASAPINHKFRSALEILGEGRSRISFLVEPDCFHAAGAAHGTIYFKMLDDAAFYAANTLVTDRFLLTTSFNLHFSKPIKGGRIVAEGRWISGRRRVLVAESWLLDEDGEEVGRGTGTFMRSRIGLSSLAGYSGRSEGS